MRYLILKFLFLFCSFWAGNVFADIAVVVNSQNQVTNLEKMEITDLFLGRYIAFPNNVMALPFDLPPQNPIRKKFYEYISGKSVAQINAYWAKLIFSGRATPPRVAPGEKEVIQMVLNNKNAIAYLDSKNVPPELKIVHLIKE